jgi:hypothetical protein
MNSPMNVTHKDQLLGTWAIFVEDYDVDET